MRDRSRSTTRDRSPGAPDLADAVSSRNLAWLALVAGILVAVCWSLQAGHNIADSAEYVEKARRWVERGELTGSLRTQRCPAFALLFVPLFLVAKWLEFEDMRPIWLVARVLQALVSVAFVLASARLAARFVALTGNSDAAVGAPSLAARARLAGFAAGLLVACNPIWLRYASDPLAGLTAGTLVALAAYLILPSLGCAPRRATSGQILRAGLYLGLASIIAYKVLPLALCLLTLVLLRQCTRRERPRAGPWSLAFAGFAAALAVGAVLDRIAYGSWGLSLSNYLVYNVMATAVPLLVAVGLEGPATSIYEFANRYYGYSGEVQTESVIERMASHPSKAWYLAHYNEFLVWPVIGLLVIGLLACLRRPRWPRSVLLVTVLAFTLVLSAKHSKSFRLMLPVLPLLAALLGLGWDELWGTASSRLRAARRALAVAILAAALPLGLLEFLRRGPRANEHFWQAIAWVDAERLREGAPSATFGSSLPFATLFRTGPELLPVQLSASLQVLPRSERSGPAQEANDKAREALGSAQERELARLDWLLVTQHVLRAGPEFRDRINAYFTLEAAFYEPHNTPQWGPLLVFRKRPPSASGRRLSRLYATAGVEEERRTEFGFSTQQGQREAIQFVAASYEALPGSGLAWISSTWELTTALSMNPRLRLYIDTPEDLELGAVDMQLGLGLHPASTWPAGAYLVEGRVVEFNSAEFEAHGGRVWASVFASPPGQRRLAGWTPVLDPGLAPAARRGHWTRVGELSRSAR